MLLDGWRDTRESDIEAWHRERAGLLATRLQRYEDVHQAAILVLDAIEERLIAPEDPMVRAILGRLRDAIENVRQP